uniref:Methylamine utilisation protein MauE domain-containing protein n=1 Tax=Sphingobacterium sp. (strain 21) TaxID=743722 RepID=F4C139_SPHS2
MINDLKFVAFVTRICVFYDKTMSHIRQKFSKTDTKIYFSLSELYHIKSRVMKAAVIEKKNLLYRVRSKFHHLWGTVRSWNWNEIFSITVVFLTILLFSYTAISKLFGHEKFVFQMRLAPVPLIKSVAPIVGWVLPFVELILAFMLYKEKTRHNGFIASLVLMILFEIYITWMKVVSITTGVDLPCTCGGVISHMGWGQHLIFNAVFIVFLTLAIHWHKRQPLNRDKSMLENSSYKP